MKLTSVTCVLFLGLFSVSCLAGHHHGRGHRTHNRKIAEPREDTPSSSLNTTPKYVIKEIVPTEDGGSVSENEKFDNSGYSNSTQGEIALPKDNQAQDVSGKNTEKKIYGIGGDEVDNEESLKKNATGNLHVAEESPVIKVPAEDFNGKDNYQNDAFKNERPLGVTPENSANSETSTIESNPTKEMQKTIENITENMPHKKNNQENVLTVEILENKMEVETFENNSSVKYMPENKTEENALDTVAQTDPALKKGIPKIGKVNSEEGSVKSELVQESNEKRKKGHKKKAHKYEKIVA